jgi:hypothetical protein
VPCGVREFSHDKWAICVRFSITQLPNLASPSVHPDQKPNDPERSRRGGEVEWRDPESFVPCHAASGSSLVTNGQCVFDFNYSITKLPIYQTSRKGEVEWRDPDNLPLPCRIREFSPQIVDRRRPRLRHFESLKPYGPDRVRTDPHEPFSCSSAASGSDDFRVVWFELRRVSGSYQGRASVGPQKQRSAQKKPADGLLAYPLN